MVSAPPPIANSCILAARTPSHFPSLDFLTSQSVAAQTPIQLDVLRPRPSPGFLSKNVQHVILFVFTHSNGRATCQQLPFKLHSSVARTCWTPHQHLSIHEHNTLQLMPSIVPATSLPHFFVFFAHLPTDLARPKNFRMFAACPTSHAFELLKHHCISDLYFLPLSHTHTAT